MSTTTLTLPHASRRFLPHLIGLLCLLLGIAFFVLMAQVDVQFLPWLSARRTLALMTIDLSFILLVLAYAVGKRASVLWQRARLGHMGTRLQSRIILIFCLMAIVPTVSVSIFSAYFFNYGIKTWFENSVSKAMESSIDVANAYLEEHKDAIRAEAASVAPEVLAKSPLLYSDRSEFTATLDGIVEAHGLSEAVVFSREAVVARSTLSYSLTFERFSEEMLALADSGNTVVFAKDQSKIQAMLKISTYPRLYLLISRSVDPQVMEHMQTARESVARYQQLQKDIRVLQEQFFLIFVLVALLVLMASIWAGMKLATRLMDPLTALMQATERVRAGDYSIKVPEGRADDEIANLGRTFNRMTQQLEAQRRDLMEANRLADERRRLTEAVLAGVSAGIVAVDANLIITLHNRTACELLGLEAGEKLASRELLSMLPEAKALIAQARERPDKVASGGVVIETPHGRAHLHVQIVAENLNETIEGFIVTFDDISELVAAQRSAAWADVARRVAHEIKNPLTPITLSADRLRKKFGPTVAADEKENFERYLDTIGRHTRDIGRMVEEFVSFARVPTPKFREENLSNLIRKIAFSEQTVHPDIRYTMNIPETPVMLNCDEAQIGQVLSNLLKNAAEAMEQVTEKSITLDLAQSAEDITLSIRDSGPGFPPQHLDKLTDPYVTTRAKGTGLGLAIVKRTVEDHSGTIVLNNPEQGGAQVVLTFPKAAA